MFPEITPTKKSDKIKRPSQHDLDDYFNELLKIWESIFEVFPELKNPEDRINMRHHNADLEHETFSDHALLFPQIQSGILAPIVRQLLDEEDPADLQEMDDYVHLLDPLKKMDWDLRKTPWTPLIRYQHKDAPDSPFAIASQGDRKTRVSVMGDICRYIIGMLEENSEESVKGDARGATLGQLNDEDFNEWWETTKGLRS